MQMLTSFNSRQHLPRAILELVRAQSQQHHLLACTRAALDAARSSDCDFALHFQPDDWVGGDYVDVVPLAGGRVFFALADVWGKGTSSAMIAAGIWSAVRCMLADGADLAGLAERLNAHLHETLPAGLFATLFAATLNPASGEMWYVNAAHHPAWLIGADGSRRLVGQEADVPLGIDAGEFREHYARLAPGDLLALYTDGCIDRPGRDYTRCDDTGRDDNPPGPADLADLLCDLCADSDVSLQSAADALAERLLNPEAPAHGPTHDDATLLLVRRSRHARPVASNALRLLRGVA